MQVGGHQTGSNYISHLYIMSVTCTAYAWGYPWNQYKCENCLHRVNDVSAERSPTCIHNVKRVHRAFQCCCTSSLSTFNLASKSLFIWQPFGVLTVQKRQNEPCDRSTPIRVMYSLSALLIVEAKAMQTLRSFWHDAKLCCIRLELEIAIICGYRS